MGLLLTHRHKTLLTAGPHSTSLRAGSRVRSVEKHSQERSAEPQIPPLRRDNGTTKGRAVLPPGFVARIENRRALHFAPPDFLLSLAALASFMRLSLRKGAHEACLVLRGRKSGYASVGMTIHIWVRDASAHENCQPKIRSQTLRMTILWSLDEKHPKQVSS